MTSSKTGSIALCNKVMPDKIPPWVILVDTETVPVNEETGQQALLLGRYEVWQVSRKTGIPNHAIGQSRGRPWRRGMFFHEEDLYLLLKSLGQSRCIAHNWQFDASVIRLGSKVTRQAYGYFIDMEKNTSFPIDKSYSPFNVQISWGEDRFTQFLDNTNFHKTSLANLGESFGISKLPMPDLSKDLLDTVKILPEELKKELSGLDSVSIGRLEIDNQFRLLVDVIKYCTRDVEVLREAWFSLFRFSWDLAKVTPGITVASMSKRIYQRRWLPAFNKDHGERFIGSLDHPLAAEAEEAAYRGGRTDVFWKGKPKSKDGLVRKYDVNSMYPSVMRARMPVQFNGLASEEDLLDGLENFSDGTTGKDIYLAKVTVKIPKTGLGFIGWEGIFICGKGLTFPVGTYTLWAWQPMLAIAHRQGWIVKTHKVFKYRARAIFRDFVEDIYGLRKEAKDKGDAPKALLLKYLMNSLYGKFGQRKFGKWERLDENDDDYIYQKAAQEVYKNDFCRWKCAPFGDYRLLSMDYVQTEAGIYRYSLGGDGMGRNSICAIAGYITTLARAKLWDAMAYIITSGDRVFMTDTDSIFTDGALPSSWVGDELGDWGEEDSVSVDECYFDAPKHYTFGGKARIKGIRNPEPNTYEYNNELRFDRWQTNLLSLKSEDRRRIDIGAFIKIIPKFVSGNNNKRRVLGKDRPTYPLVLPLKESKKGKDVNFPII